MLTRSAQVLAVVTAPVPALAATSMLLVCVTVAAALVAGVIAFAAPLLTVFPLMAVAVGAMGLERVLLPWNVAPALTRADHETSAAPLGLR